MVGAQPRGPRNAHASNAYPWQVLREIKKAEKQKVKQAEEEKAKKVLEKKKLKKIKCKEKKKGSEKWKEAERERKKIQKKKKKIVNNPVKKEEPKLTPSQINKRQKKKKGKNQTVLIDDQGEEEEFGIVKRQRIRHPHALVREVKLNQKLKTGNKDALRAIKSKPRIKVRKLRGDGQGAKGNHPLRTHRVRAKRNDMSKLEDVKRHVQFLGGGLKVAWTERPGRSESGIEWMAHRSIEEEMALRKKKKKKKEMLVPEQSTKLNFKNIDGDMAFQLLANMPTTSKISFGTCCILIYNYATETKAQKDALASGILSGAIKYISFLNMGDTKEGSSGSVQTIGGVQLRANCGLQVVFRSPISTQVMKQLLTDCSSAEIISFGDSCRVDFKSVKEAEDNWKTLQKLVLKNEKNNISFEELSILCVEPDSDAANNMDASEELKLLENINEDENQTNKNINEKLIEIEKKKRKMEDDEDEYGQYEMQAKKKKESVT